MSMSSYRYELVKENDMLPARFDMVACPSTTIPAHWHKYLEILCMIRGSLTAVIQARTYVLQPGDVLVINSEDIHMTQTFGEETVYILLQVSAAQLSAFFSDFHLLRFQTYIPNAAENGVPSPRSLLVELQSIYQAREDGYPLLFSARLHELLYCLYRGFSKWLTPGAHLSIHRNFSGITQTLDWIHGHYREPLRLDEAAARLGFSKEYFCRIFKEYTGQTFLEYVNSVRAAKVYEDLYRTDDSLTLLMARHGITNYKVFLRTFRALYGDTPQRLRTKKRDYSST